MDDRPITAIVVNYRTPALAIECVRSLAAERAGGSALDVVLVDGGSDDGSAEQLAAAIAGEGWGDWVEPLALTFNGGFGWANNQALRRIARRAEPADYVYLVNPDATVAPGTIARLRAALVADPGLAAVGGGLVAPRGERVGAAFRFPTPASEFFRGAGVAALERWCGQPPLTVTTDTSVAVDWVTGANVLFRVAALREVGFFDEGFFLYFEEVELMHRLRAAGWGIRHDPGAVVVHVGGAATGVSDGASRQPRLPPYWHQSRRRYFARTGGRGRALAASAAWSLGLLIRQVRRLTGLGGAGRHAPREFRDMLAGGVLPRRRDLAPAIPAWDGPIGERPAWAAATR